MAVKNRPYEQFAHFVLLKKLESDALGELWRARTLEPAGVETVALRRLTGGHRESLTANTQAIAPVLPKLNGTSFVRNQQSGVSAGLPFIAWEYSGGRSLRFIMDRATGAGGRQSNPLPLDQAVAIAERIALSLATLADFRDTSGARLSHGALLPHVVWVTEEGEIRVGGQQLGAGIISSLSDARVSSEIARYFSVEYRNGSRSAADSDVYSLGAVFFLMVTGQEPPDSASASAFSSVVRAATTMTGDAIPVDVRKILDRSLNLDPTMRFATMAEMKQALSSLAHGGAYAATTFNLAFYLSTLLKDEWEAEAAERTQEETLDPASLRQAAPVPRPVTEEPRVNTAPLFTTVQQKPKSRMGMVAAVALLVLAAAGAGLTMMMKSRGTAPAVAAATAPTASASMVPPAASTPPISTPVLAATAETTSVEGEGEGALAADPEAQKKAFDAAVREKLQAEMMKLQNAFMAELQTKQARNAPVTIAAPPPAADGLTPEERATLTAAQQEQQRREARASEVAEQRASVAPQPIPAPPAAQPAQPAAVPAVVPAPAVKEGDVVDVSTLDALPRPLRPIRPVYPPLAARQKIAATIILSALIAEDGQVSEVRVLRGDPRFGLNDAAIRAMQATRFSPPVKEGKRVRTWFPQTIEFNPD